MNKAELESIMKRFGDTQAVLATYLGLSRTRFNVKLNERNNASFTQPEIKAIKDRYNLSAEQVSAIFFAN